LDLKGGKMMNEEDLKKVIKKESEERSKMVETYYNPFGNTPDWLEKLENGELDPY
jgi:hypothetical protein